MRIILTGATGLVGGEVLRQALADPRVGQVTVLTRRTLGIRDPRLRELILADFLDYAPVGDALDADACIWCLGVSQTAVGPQDYLRITLDYPVAAAQALFARNPGMRFCFVSGAGADPQERTAVLYRRIKGRAEKHLRAISPNAFSFRPAFIRPPAGRRRPLVVKLYTPLADVMDRFTDGFSVECAQLARCLLDVARQGADQPTLDNRTIKNWATPAFRSPHF
ncbi:MAG: NAD(P)H-binding protein [Parvibaculum sp.]|uniref:NAD(P)H-binding protein n=1 Tax=Parvibaculum sp. TaxID=2024848 RepID=UPI00272F7D22|nr:NAD(P)H-binding protein [Parvibaculum sp.]MDP1627278.1 NAD(P)H-binding protein [Parvibaculum sp.]MDP2151933.1 NAD(P)H-binding protein [Parvibaculum sp.]